MGDEIRKRNPEDMFFDHDVRIRLLEKEVDAAKVSIEKAQALAEKETARAKLEVEKDTENALESANREIEYVKVETAKIQKSVDKQELMVVEQGKTISQLDKNLSKLMVRFGVVVFFLTIAIEVAIRIVWK